ncbi:MAG TPA: TRAM domain-containing protein, partial [Candidatus Acidoferrales bacterium]|nr:TRAM domain-containing protein [Candidatus Acidoferrales bacterium]
MRIKIEKLVYGGEGLAHQEGKALFVPFVLPGEEVDVEIVERTKKLDRGRVTRLLEPSPNRIEPRCSHFGVCGGCDYQHISYDAQLELKEQILRETLYRIGRIDWDGPIAIHRSSPWEYRNRAQWKVRSLPSHSQRDGAETKSIGYFRARSSVLCPVQTCSIISPALLATFHTLRDTLAGGALPPTLREI